MSRVVLSVEDDNAAYRLLEIAFEDLSLDFVLHRTLDGDEGLRFLRKVGSFADAPRPDLVLLNLNLPRVGGREVLAEIRRDPLLKEIPVVVFSSSSLDADRAECLALGARHFITKPDDFDNLLQAVTTACTYVSA